MSTSQYIEQALQHCFLALYHQNGETHSTAAYSTLFATLSEQDVPACQRKYYRDLKQTFLAAISLIEQNLAQQGNELFIGKLRQKMLIQLLEFYKQTCGWLAVEEYIASRNTLLYHHAHCE
ncbi:hypothetical protein EGT71_20760 [Atlantibacter subterranea]|uniref:Uncharacterized protein n=1 Tax=Atlantibacter subterraneus TaxID=255519 RepID=A0A3R9EZA5_9ENTR|nr:hypothetical protein [Atlantibacter subterranea]MDA3131230.1 hypothetical protein [Atlantibacter subterranea]RSE05600.1 hypothetical protein EGT84_12565 [Atlantibacter subterranea]RSE22513.1 hypothetical protein EGT71_20760 [Atlantibacter subterranea]